MHDAMAEGDGTEVRFRLPVPVLIVAHQGGVLRASARGPRGTTLACPSVN